MDRMKTFFKYAMWIILFFIFSNLLIDINLESTYKNIGRKDNLPQISIYQAQATKLNGRIKGTIYNNTENKVKGKYLKVDLYSERNVLLGSKYIDISNIKENETQEIELYFKLQDVEYYSLSFTDEKKENEITLLPHDMTREQIIWGTFFTILIFW